MIIMKTTIIITDIRRGESVPFCRAMLCISAAYMPSCGVCPSVCLSRSCILSKRVIISSNFFLPSGSHIILVFPHQTLWHYYDGDPPIMRCRMQVWWANIAILDQYLHGFGTDHCWAKWVTAYQHFHSIGYSTCASSVSREQQKRRRATHQ